MKSWVKMDLPIRFPGGRHESSIRSIRKGDSLSGVSLSPIRIPSPILASPTLESSTLGAGPEQPWGLSDISVLEDSQHLQLKAFNCSEMHIPQQKKKKKKKKAKSRPFQGTELVSDRFLVDRSGPKTSFSRCRKVQAFHLTKSNLLYHHSSSKQRRAGLRLWGQCRRANHSNNSLSCNSTLTHSLPFRVFYCRLTLPSLLFLSLCSHTPPAD